MSLVLEFAGRSIRVEGYPAALVWLEEFLTPYFRVIRTPTPHRIVRFTVEPRAHAQLCANGPHPLRDTVDCFTLDRKVLTAVRWNGPGDASVAFDQVADVFYRQGAHGQDVIEIIAQRDDGAARISLMRVVRELGILHAVGASWLPLHAAAACVGDDAFVIAGPKRAGKTTLLLHALRNQAGAYLSNDRVAVRVDPPGPLVHGIPTLISIRPESVEWFAGLSSALAEARYNSLLTLDECGTRAASAWNSPAATWSLSPRQLCLLLGVESRARTRLTALLFPQIEPVLGRTRFERLLPDQARLAAARSLFPRPRGMFQADDDLSVGGGDHTGTLLRDLLVKVPSFRCHLGIDAYTPGSTWFAELAQTVLRAAPSPLPLS